MTSSESPASHPAPSAGAADLRTAQMAWLAAAVFVVSAGYGALLPLLPGWLAPLMEGATSSNIARHVGFLSSVYAAGVLLGAPLWGLVSDRVGRGRILILGLVGYVASLLLLLVPGFAGLAWIYALRGMTGFFVAAVIPVVSALVAEHTPEPTRARRFAWLGAMSLLGFLFGPGLDAVLDGARSWISDAGASPAISAKAVLVLSALLGAAIMLGLARTLPAYVPAIPAPQAIAAPPGQSRATALLCLNGVLMFVLAGFELGIVLQGQQSDGVSARQAAIMLAACSLVMLGINAFLFLTSLMEKIPARILMVSGLLVALGGLAVLTGTRSELGMLLGVSLTSAGTGLVLPVIAYLSAGASPRRLGATMGGLAAAAGLGQTVGSAAGGWLFAALGQRSFGWLTLPLLVMLGLMLARPGWWNAMSAGSILPAAGPADKPSQVSH
jgi:MFS family permease